MTKLIYIVEDDESIRELIQIALASFSYEAKSFSDAESAILAIEKNIPDLLLLDIMLPGLSGIDATKQLRKNPKTKKLPIILITAMTTDLDKAKGLDNGADDYITKPFSIIELGARIRAIFRRIDDVKNEETETLQIADLSLNQGTREITKQGNLIKLTFKEYELLQLLIKENERIVTRFELLAAVWGEKFAGEPRTLDIHIQALRKKLGDDAENPKYIQTARNVGYRFIGK